MKITKCKVSNFGSYNNLEFAFDYKGLYLIHGPTGAGKSTLCDIIPWVLFGHTSKNGSVDEVLSWNSMGYPTEGVIELGDIQIVRKRNPNDLYIIPIAGGEAVRGKDLLDTQKLINHHLGIDCDLYLAGSHYHEFSQAAQFFTASAKNRRLLCEQIVDLSLPKRLQSKLVEIRKKEEIKLKQAEVGHSQVNYVLEVIRKDIIKNSNRVQEWHIAQDLKITLLRKELDDFEDTRRIALECISTDIEKVNKTIKTLALELSEISDAAICTECGANSKHKEVSHAKVKMVSEETRLVRLQDNYNNMLAKENTYLDQIDKAITAPNPYSGLLSDSREQQTVAQIDAYVMSAVIDTAKYNLADYEVLGEILEAFRSRLIGETVEHIQKQTNTYLNDYFNAEIMVTFSATSADKVEVTIQKDEHVCSYTQLSKGQRCLLKLCFGLSVMKYIAAHHAIKFESIFIDEAFDGLDEAFKSKAYRLLTEFAVDYKSVFVVEHSTMMKEQFVNKIEVRLDDKGNSVINEET